jgi:hypothetical protein
MFVTACLLPIAGAAADPQVKLLTTMITQLTSRISTLEAAQKAGGGGGAGGAGGAAELLAVEKRLVEKQAGLEGRINERQARIEMALMQVAQQVDALAGDGDDGPAPGDVDGNEP